MFEKAGQNIGMAGTKRGERYLPRGNPHASTRYNADWIYGHQIYGQIGYMSDTFVVPTRLLYNTSFEIYGQLLTLSISVGQKCGPYI